MFLWIRYTAGHLSFNNYDMKKFLFLLIAGFCTVQLSGQTINFSVQPLSGESELSAASQEMLQNKLRQIITRNSAGAANDYNVFVIEPVITVLDKQSTSGLMRNTTLVKGELTLVAKNRIDGSMYHSAVVFVVRAGCRRRDPYKAMISALRTTDPVYTRFIRIARQKIQDYYAANCATILQKAQSLYNLKKYPEALSYLSAVVGRVCLVMSRLPCSRRSWRSMCPMYSRIR